MNLIITVPQQSRVNKVFQLIIKRIFICVHYVLDFFRGLCTGFCIGVRIGDYGLDYWLLLLSFPFRSPHFVSFHFLTTF